MSDILKIETENHVSVLTLNRPEAMNALDYPLYMALEDAIRQSEARCIVITGAGERAFCSGDDVKQILSKGAPSTPEMAERAKATGGLTPCADALLHTDIPVIAAVNGFALGWGAELAIMADIRVMAETAKFGEIFVTRGLCCDAPGLGRLAQLVGREQASELLFTGEIIDAAQAKEIGLVSRVVPQADLLPTALGIAQKIAANPPQEDDDFGLGSLAATMLPYSVGLMISGLALTIAWVVLDLPLGPGAEVFMEVPATVSGSEVAPAS